MRFWLRAQVIVLTAALFGFFGFAELIAEGALQPARAQDSSVEFRDTLSSYGRWVEHPRWGAVFIPAGVPADWRPYRFGHWVYTDEWGWYWVSDEEWGWITYHYGRWLWDRDLGWFWIPDPDWGPAWVSWRRGEDVVGWAPMPPDDYVIEDDVEPVFWSFVRPADVIAPSLATVVLPAAQATVFIHQTVFVNPTVVVREHDRVVVANPGIPPAIIAAHVGHPLQTVAVQPHVIAGTVGVTSAIVGPPPKGAGVRELVKPQTTLIEPVAHIPPPTAYRPGAPVLGPNAPKVLEHVNVMPTTKPAAPKLPENAPNTPHGIPPTSPSAPSHAPALGERPPGPPSMRPAPNVGVAPRPLPPSPGIVHAPTPPVLNPPHPPVVTGAPRPPPPRAPEPPRKCAVVNGQQVCR
jgi:hypothetical protein